MVKQSLLLLGLFYFFTSACSAKDTILEPEALYWFPSIDGIIQNADNNLSGTKIKLKDDLGIKDEEFPDLRLTWHTGPNSRLRLTSMTVDYSGSTNLSKNVAFGGVNYSAGIAVNTDLQVEHANLGWTWQFLNFFNDSLKLGTVFETTFLKMDAAIAAGSTRETDGFSIVFPTIGGAFDWLAMERLRLSLQITGMSAGNHGYFINGELGVKYLAFKHFTVETGYRMIDVTYKNKQDKANLRLAGPYLGATVRF